MDEPVMLHPEFALIAHWLLYKSNAGDAIRVARIRSNYKIDVSRQYGKFIDSFFTRSET